MSNPERVVGKKAKVVEVKPNNSNCGGFQPFQREKKRVFSESNDPQPAAVKAVDSAPAVKAVASAPAPATTTSSTTETCGVVGKGERNIYISNNRKRNRKRVESKGGVGRRSYTDGSFTRFSSSVDHMVNDFNYLFSDWLSLVICD